MKNNHLKMIKAMIAFSVLSSLTLAVSSCKSRITFEEIQEQVATEVPTISEPDTNVIDTPIPVSYKQDMYTDSFELSESTQTITQETLDTNISTVGFQVKKSDGNLLDTLTTSDFTLKENNVSVSNLTLTKNSVTFKQTVDIAFAVDVTGSMTSTIESAKLRLTNFVNNTRALGYHTRMCLITFGDYTIKKCDKFYDNDPNDASTLTQVNELISEISKLKSLTGVNDPGGYDLNENPMRALIDASKAAWATNNQRFLILITDDGFLYSPGNQGSVGTVAPYYKDVKAAIASSGIKVFAVTPSKSGYNKNFGSDKGIVELSQGEWFNFSDLISGKITLDTVLNKIINNVNTTFIAQFVSEENSGLDASLPLNKRTFSIELKSSISGTVQSINAKSNLPDGRTSYKKEFTLSSKKIKSSTAKVYINNILQTNGYEVLNSGIVKFTTAPAAGSIIKVIYRYENISDSILTKTILINRTQNLDTIEVELNGIKADSEDFTVSKTLEGKYTVSINESAYNPNDKYGVDAVGKLEVKVIVNYHE